MLEGPDCSERPPRLDMVEANRGRGVGQVGAVAQGQPGTGSSEGKGAEQPGKLGKNMQ